MEDYKKKYEQALEIARKINNGDGVPTPPDYTICETIFPELKESEDERIRKTIKLLIEMKENDSVGLEPAYGASYKEMIAWLEKQGEQNSTDKVEPKFKVGDTMRTLQEAADGIKDGLPVIVSIDDTSYRCINEIIDIKDQDNYEYPPMNRATTWSEEDEMMLKEALRMIEKPGSMFKGEILTKKVADWLRFFKARVQPKPKQEWNEEDEKLIEEVADSLRKYSDYVQGGNSKVYVLSLADSIESLQPQYIWKPSDEQMKALNNVFNDISAGWDDSVIESLYNDLKKLRKE